MPINDRGNSGNVKTITQNDALSDFSTQLDAITNSATDANGKLKYTREHLTALKKAYEDQNAALKKNKDAMEKSILATRGLSETGKLFKQAVQVTAEQYSEASGIMTTARTEEAKSIREQLSAMVERAKQEKDSTSVAILAKTRRDADIKQLKSNIENMRGLSAAASASGDKSKALGLAMKANAMEAGLAAGQVGQYFGATAATMGNVAMVAGGLLIALGALAKAFNIVAQDATAAAKAGIRINSVAGGPGAEFGLEAASQSRGMYGAVSGAQLMDAVAQSQKEYGASLLYQKNAYDKVVEGTDKYRAELVTSGLKIVADSAKIGSAFGMSLEESVRLSAMLASKAKAGSKDAQQGMFSLLNMSNELMIPLDGLTSIFSILADNANILGTSAMEVASQVKASSDVMLQLSKAQVDGYKNMDPEKMQRMTKEFVSAVTGINSLRMAAISQKAGEGGIAAIERVRGMGMGGRMNMIREMANREGITLDVKKASAEEKLMLTRMLGISTGDVGSDIDMGNRLMMASKNKNFGMDQLQKLQSESIDSKLKSTMSVGTSLAAGNNVFNIMANTLGDILRVLVEGVNKFGMGSKTSRDLGAKYEQADSQSAKASKSLRYGGSSLAAGRSRVREA